MARRSKPPAPRRKPKAAKPAKPAKPGKPKKQKPKKDASEKDVKPGMPLESAVAILTGVMLLVAILLVFYEKGVHYEAGPFKGMYDSGEAE